MNVIVIFSIENIIGKKFKQFGDEIVLNHQATDHINILSYVFRKKEDDFQN